jgi:hypothetical protein
LPTNATLTLTSLGALFPPQTLTNVACPADAATDPTVTAILPKVVADAYGNYLASLARPSTLQISPSVIDPVPAGATTYVALVVHSSSDDVKKFWGAGSTWTFGSIGSVALVPSNPTLIPSDVITVSGTYSCP